MYDASLSQSNCWYFRANDKYEY